MRVRNFCKQRLKTSRLLAIRTAAVARWQAPDVFVGEQTRDHTTYCFGVEIGRVNNSVAPVG